MLCPCITELDTAHVGKPIVTPKDSLTLSNTEMMENDTVYMLFSWAIIYTQSVEN